MHRHYNATLVIPRAYRTHSNPRLHIRPLVKRCDKIHVYARDEQGCKREIESVREKEKEEGREKKKKVHSMESRVAIWPISH